MSSVIANLWTSHTSGSHKLLSNLTPSISAWTTHGLSLITSPGKMTSVLIRRNAPTDSCHNLTALMPRCTKTSFIIITLHMCSQNSDNLHNAGFIGYSLVREWRMSTLLWSYINCITTSIACSHTFHYYVTKLVLSIGNCAIGQTSLITRTHYRVKDACQKHVLSFTHSPVTQPEVQSICRLLQLTYLENYSIQLISYWRVKWYFKIGNKYISVLFHSLRGNKSRVDFSKL